MQFHRDKREPMNNVFAQLILIGFFAGSIQVAMGQNKPSSDKSKLPATQQNETPHVEFVKEYIRELIDDEDLTTRGEKELSNAKTPFDAITTGIYVFTSDQLLLRDQIGMLKTMRLNAPFDQLIPTLINFYEQQIDLYQQLIETEKKMLEGPTPGVDYAALSVKIPQLRARLDNVQDGVFKTAAMVVWTLIDQKADSQHHLSHLVITQAEKADLQSQLDLMLKNEPENGDHDLWVSSAMVVRGGLNRGHKCADEPWQ